MHIGDEEIRNVAQEIWSSVVGAELVPSAPRPLPGAHSLVGWVGIDGPWCGTLAIYGSEAVARRAADAMFAAEAGPAELRDAWGELANMIGGNLKALLPGPSRLSLPSVAPGIASSDAGEALQEVWFECDGEPLRVALYTGEAVFGEAAEGWTP